MKNLLMLGMCASVSSLAAAVNIDDLAKRVDALEYQSFENTLSWSGYFENRYDALTVRPTGKDKYTLNIMRNLAGIDFKAKPLPNVAVFGRLAYSNILNNMPTGSTSARGYSSPLASFERLFIDYTILDNLVFTFGRLPTLDGPPNQIYDGLSRQGSYPRQVYSTSVDGYGLTYNFNFSESQTLAARVIYSTLGHIAYANGIGVVLFDRDELITRTPAGDVKTGAYHDSITPVTSWMLEYNLEGSPVARTINMIYQGFSIKHFQMSPDWHYDYLNNSFYLELNNIANTGLILYESYGISSTKSTGGVQAGPAGNWSLGKNELNAKVSGAASITGLVYKIPSAIMKNPLIGYEAYKGDKEAIQFDFAAKDPMGFYVNRGTGTHIFYTQPLNTLMKLRLGMMESKQDYAPGFPISGEPKASGNRYKSLYVNLRTDF